MKGGFGGQGCGFFSFFSEEKPDIVVNLAAQAGVRYSIDNPDAYIQSNIVGFFHILEACRHYPVEHLVFASSSYRIRRKREGALSGGGPGGQAGEPVCGDQKIQRADGLCLQQALPDSSDGAAFFYGIWADGQAGHGIF